MAASAPRKKKFSWRNLLLQALLLLGIGAVAIIVIQNTAANLQKQGIASGFAFLNNTAGFDIILHLIPYDATSTYGRAFVVALLNTLLVAALGIIGATILGFAIGLMRLSKNWLVSRLAGAYVELLRNLPLLLQLFLWYFAVLRDLPGPRASFQLLPHVYLNIRGLYMPWPVHDAGGWRWDVPVLGNFDFEGGIVLLPELVALLLALSFYTAAFIAEIVRAGILSVGRGQEEAALALGLNRRQTLRHVVVPQAMRVIIPPLTSQYLNLTKNSSLAAAIAYPDLVLVFAGTVLMQTGQAVEVIAMTMGVYLTISLFIAALMNLYNRRQARGYNARAT